MQFENIPITLQIGKNGLNENVLKEIDKQLKARKVIKIKFLKSAFENDDRFSLAERIVETSNSEVLQFIGNTLVIRKK